MRRPSKDMALEITRSASGGTPMVADAVEGSVQAAVRAQSSGGESRGTSYRRRCAELLWRSAASQNTCLQYSAINSAFTRPFKYVDRYAATPRQ